MDQPIDDLRMRISLSGQSFAQWNLETLRIIAAWTAWRAADEKQQSRAVELIDLVEAEIGVIEALETEVDSVEIAGQIDGIRARMRALLLELQPTLRDMRGAGEPHQPASPGTVDEDADTDSVDLAHNSAKANGA